MIVNVCGVPEQPLAVGVTVIVVEIAAAPPLVAVNAGVPPVPLADDNPTPVLLFVQA